MMEMRPQLAQKQTQTMVLTQKMQQALQILQLSGIELDQFIREELETNPVLEQASKEPDPLEAASVVREKDSAQVREHDANEAFDEPFDLDDFASQWDRRRAEGRDLSINRDLDGARQFYQDSITKEESLSAHLMSQLHLAVEDPARLAIGERIIGDINDRGYFTGSLEAIAADVGTPVEEVERVLFLIQRFEPIGVGARDVVECLLLQINVEYPDVPELRELVGEHLEALEHHQIPQIAKAMNTTPGRVEELRALLGRLNPWPGYEYDSDPAQYIAPDVVVEKVNGEFVVSLANERASGLQLSDYYREMAKNKAAEREDRKFIREKLESAKWLISNVAQREQTILRVAQAIVDVQKEFMVKGVEAIKPLTLQEIADIVGVHEATVSRTTRGKYIQTPQGLFELKYFFSPGLKHDSGEAQSSKSVQSLIKTIIEEENKKKPLSDQKIADLLKEQGINIARRTVTKYREKMNLPAAGMRKKYGG